MTIGLVFWILMLIWLVFGLWDYWNQSPFGGWRAHSLFLFILLLLLGWGTFGAPLRV